MENIKYQAEDLILVVADLAAKYTGYEHSSLTYEKAQTLMEAVLFCISEYESENKNTLLTNISVKQMYQLGKQLVIKKIRTLHELYNKLILTFQDYGSECLKKTITKSIPIFLTNYDIEYAPHETILSLDYPILKDLSASCGINKVLEYVKCIYFEQQFLEKFDNTYIYANLNAYHYDYQILIENIFIIILQNQIGHILIHKSINQIGFCKEDYISIEKLLLNKSNNEIEEYIENILRYLVKHYFKNDMLLLEYILCATSDISTRIKNCLENQCLDKVFIV